MSKNHYKNMSSHIARNLSRKSQASQHKILSYNSFLSYMRNNKSPQAIKEQETGKTISMRTFDENVLLLDNSVTHENRTQVQIKSVKTPNLFVTNQYVRGDGNEITKITQIQLQDRIIKIIDRYVPSEPSQFAGKSFFQTSTQIVNECPVHRKLLDRRILNSRHDDSRHRDVRNVVKNIFRLFQSWVQKNSAPDLQLGALLTNLFNSTGKYNNSLILKITKDPQLRKTFLNFSNNEGEEMIASSRINDKDSHYEALRRYGALCEKEEKCCKCGKQRSSQNKNLKVCNKNKSTLEESIKEQQQKDSQSYDRELSDMKKKQSSKNHLNTNCI